jgi:hypothetical protein
LGSASRWLARSGKLKWEVQGALGRQFRLLADGQVSLLLREVTMSQFDLPDTVESLRDIELLRYAKEYVRLSIAESGNRHSEVHSIVDLIFAECARRGKEWLYDKAREMVHREITESCNGAGVEKRARRTERRRAAAYALEEEESGPIASEIC